MEWDKDSAGWSGKESVLEGGEKDSAEWSGEETVLDGVEDSAG